MSAATGLVIHFSRCNAPARSAEWSGWVRDEHLSSMEEVQGVRAATHWALTQQPTPGMPSVGFSHVSLYELSGSVKAGAERLAKHYVELQEAGQIDRNHCLMNVDVLEAHGRWAEKPEPTEALIGHILAYVMCNDPQRYAEWDRWNDEVHMPDMLSSDGFAGVSRWRRSPPAAWGTQYLTLYDVGPIGVDEAVARSAAIMPNLKNAGRKLDCHVGGLTVTLERA